MEHDVSTASQREEIRQLIADGTRFSQQRDEFESDFRQRSEATQRKYLEDLEQLERETANEIDRLDTQFTDKLEAARLTFEERVEQLNNIRNKKSDEASRQRADEIARAKHDIDAVVLQLKDILERDHEKTDEQQNAFLAKCEQSQAELDQLVDDLNDFLAIRGLPAISVTPKSTASNDWSSTCMRRFSSAYKLAANEVATMQRWTLVRSLDGVLSFVVVIVLAASLWFPIGYILAYERIFWIPAVLIATVAATVVYRLIAHRFLANRIRDRLPAVESHLLTAAESLSQATSAAKREAEAAVAEQKTQFAHQLKVTTDEAEQQTQEAETTFIRQSRELEETYQRSYLEVERTWEAETERIRGHFGPQLDALRQRLDAERERLKRDHHRRQESLEAEFEQRAAQAQQHWADRLAHFESFYESANRVDEAHTINWSETDWTRWTPSMALPHVVPLGRYWFDIKQLIGSAARPSAGTPAGEPTADGDGSTPRSLPSFLAFPNEASLLIRASGDGRGEAVRILQSAMLRMLVTLPPGKVRFTIFDPTGLGQNFSAFMHLADHDERLVGRRIWTESAHIQQRLTDLTEHMENVIQKYLRNEFPSIQDYNEHAGEVAEPFRVLVVANFPSHFSEEATRRLISIANSGPRCGVYTFISIDEGIPLPRHIQLQDLKAHANVLNWDGEHFHWEAEPLNGFTLQMEEPPDDQLMTSIIKSVGRHAENSNRVEVPFAAVAPDPKDWWNGNNADELVVPLGRAGATKQLALRLGRGTSQHVLISGKTGSGKSTLLHALVTNAALTYSPNELHFYLIDFKKGVEFKPYADLKLPHARVVAIESEREFGLSVLQKLDQELRRRGDLFRSASVQSLAAYREATDDPLPRILLIVDEFQEFFVNDDKIAHESSLLMDRLVRQGRAFGMHLVLGSQTLAGAYTLARSTIGQMAVRIALQCSAADAHLILSEDNTAARLLGRPGEAIYNDANGLIEGNHPFQVVWLPDNVRADYLRRIQQLAESEQCQFDPPIVFEGHAAADLKDNSELERRLTLGPTSESAEAGVAWLGAAVAIKTPTAVEFRRQGGTNLLIVGQNQELAMGMLLSSLISLAAARPFRETTRAARRSATFYVLDGEHERAATKRFEDLLDDKLTIDARRGGPRDASGMIGQLCEIVRQRTKGEGNDEPVYLLIHDLARFRELKPAGDDFGFSSFGDERGSSSASQLAEVLRDGPAVGVHSLVWADSYNSVTRWFERAILRDFAFRILFQMSAADSSNLMDSAAAGNLGPYRALFYNDDRGESEKFRPYGLPSSKCLDWIVRHMADHASESTDDNQGPATSESGSLV